ncbi:hypothetical protein Hanom_Chr13g01221751 [Helianthus anomalus]
MKFKELFGSFTRHRIENRTSGTRCESTGSTRSENWINRDGEPVADGSQAVGDTL